MKEKNQVQDQELDEREEPGSGLDYELDERKEPGSGLEVR